MRNVEDAFFQGLVDGAADHEALDKVAEAFFAGLADGADDANHTPIMDKIASALDLEDLDVDEDTEVEAEAEEAEEETEKVATVSERVIDLIRGN